MSFNLQQAIDNGTSEESSSDLILLKKIVQLGPSPTTGIDLGTKDSWISSSDLTALVKLPNVKCYALVYPKCTNKEYDEFIASEIVPLGLAFSPRGQSTEGKKCYKFAIVSASAKV